MSEAFETREEDAPVGVGRPGPLSLAVAVGQALGALTLALYALWAACQLLGNTGSVMAAEEAALTGLGDLITGEAGMTRGGPAVAAGWIVICVLSALVIRYLAPMWVKKIRTEWVWVKRQFGGAWWEKLLGIVGFILVAIEVVFFVLVMVVMVVVVIINIAVLVRVMPVFPGM